MRHRKTCASGETWSFDDSRYLMLSANGIGAGSVAVPAPARHGIRVPRLVLLTLCASALVGGCDDTEPPAYRGESGAVEDAVVCLLAAKDFLAGRAVPPPDAELAATEGWIWAA